MATPARRHVVYHKGDGYMQQTDIATFEVADDVEVIETGAFFGCTGITSLEGMRNSSVKEIGKHAFLGSGITSLEGMPSTVVYIGVGAFCATRITSLEGMSHAVTKIDNLAFRLCADLTSLQGMSQAAESIGVGAFSACADLVSLQGMSRAVTRLQDDVFKESGIISLQGMPHAVTTIGIGAFEGTCVTSLDDLPNSVTRIGAEAFAHCADLTSVGRGLRPECEVHYSAFEGCEFLRLEANRTRLGHPVALLKAVWLRPNLRWAVLQSVQTARRLVDAHGDAAQVGSLLRLIATVPSGNNSTPLTEGSVLRRIVEYVGDLHVVYREGDSYRGRVDIRSFEVASGVEEIGKGAFEFADNITSLEPLRHSSVTTICESAFANNFGIKSLDGLAPSIKFIDAGAFQHCFNLTSIGEGFHQDCVVDPTAFKDCDYLVKRAAIEGFESVEEWGKHVWKRANLDNYPEKRITKDVNEMTQDEMKEEIEWLRLDSIAMKASAIAYERDLAALARSRIYGEGGDNDER
jgi:hypothetical protein